MFGDLLYITVYWLSGFAENQYEIWESKKISIVSSSESLSFSAYQAWPQEVAEDGQITIHRTDAGLVFATDWFPDEEFDLQLFASHDDGGLILMSKFLRETFFIHLRKQYE
jgi:hypothetical protein